MFKNTQTIRRQITYELFVLDHFVELALKGLNNLDSMVCYLMLVKINLIIFYHFTKFFKSWV